MTNMLCLRRFYPIATRRFNCRTWSSDTLLNQLDNFTNEHQVFSLVSKNRARLSEKHVKSAIKKLVQVQKTRPWSSETMDYIRSHSQFFVLRILAENKIECMDDEALVDVLYSMLWFDIDSHDSLVEELVIEGWKRLNKLTPPLLSKFALCVHEQHLHQSPLMGEIANVVDKKLDSIQDSRALSVVMNCISSIISWNLKERLIEKADSMFERTNISVNDARRFVQFLRNISFLHRPLLKKCNNIFVQHSHELRVEDISIILGLYQNLQFNNTKFRLLAKKKLIELKDNCSSPLNVMQLFVHLAPMVQQEMQKEISEKVLLIADDLDWYQTLIVAEKMQEVQYRNPLLIEKIVSLFQKYLDRYKPYELLRVTNVLAMLHWPKSDIYSKLQQLSICHLQVKKVPADILMLVHVLSNLPSPYVDEAVVTQVDAIIPQCNLNQLDSFTVNLLKWMKHHKPNQKSYSGPYGSILQKINSCAFQRLEAMNKLDLLLKEFKYLHGKWFQEVLLEKTIVALHRLRDQITWSNVVKFASFLTGTNYRCTLLLDKVAAVATEHIDQIYHSEVQVILVLFSLLNYEPPEAEKFFEACINRISLHLEDYEPSLLVLLGFALASSGYFPQKVLKAIFNIEFLSKLDAELQIVPWKIARKTSLQLMELNRAVCLECPELQIPWFHKRFCEQLKEKKTDSSNLLQQQIYILLGEILGRSHYARCSVLTSYCYRIDFEFMIDKNKKPVPYIDQHVPVPNSDHIGSAEAGHSCGKKGLPPGFQRIAVEFLDSEAFCKNSNHVKGFIAMKKRHLEILGYQVVQIPYYEWNSMGLSSTEAKTEYLEKKIFQKL
ncbi:FAST kinase domain-containing protein 1, mitochondrial [Pseudonaja textilis]|uniref:FAST kinase domain-containing protein 1, mitochondrial n=1 Tax=Pseudonaja textilis TaxID=8673 RepID=UPI000EA8C7F7|nr:FAST kinase domain-containing protein 1, mitochondrial [Pseudonaja textilis]XP_026552875.1 FAST kinase domain-containing protein 1, mitochondrial [Pseudonaja textilis]XP_026552876.1 FAST kinase domain-containing protein 1, mitochondrial [Pseudonaja textilis]